MPNSQIECLTMNSPSFPFIAHLYYSIITDADPVTQGFDERHCPMSGLPPLIFGN